MVTVWTPKATAELKKAFDYISQNSPQNAKKVIDEIIALADKLPRNPEMYGIDKYKRNNDGSWRAFEKFHYRISYHITQKDIQIVRMRHTSRTPLSY
jgi:addiction module RelE/StbE family toxin